MGLLVSMYTEILLKFHSIALRIATIGGFRDSVPFAQGQQNSRAISLTKKIAYFKQCQASKDANSRWRLLTYPASFLATSMFGTVTKAMDAVPDTYF